MKNKAIAIEWLKRAKSNLEIAIIGKLSNTILYEDLCFECQQAVEKALKGFLIFIEIPFSKTHSISYLIDMALS
ncbi:MAG: HEPN domain-containing protein [Candidatus Magnetobacterium sp. LHC-1]